jgi:hypothetical protein
MDLAFYWSCAVFIDLKKRFSKPKSGNNSKKARLEELAGTPEVFAVENRNPVGSEPARDCGSPDCTDVACANAIASRLTPTMISGEPARGGYG